MKLAAVAASLVLTTGTVVVVRAQEALTCPPSAPFDVSTFTLPSGDGCLLCVPTMESCGVTCSCPTLDCDVYTCNLTPAGCGDVVCAGDGRRVYPTPAPTKTPTTSPTKKPTRPPTVPPPTMAIVPTAPEESRSDCGGYETCRGCLSDSRCASWYNAGTGCFADNCPVADAPCYNTVFNPTQTPEMLCDAAARDEANKVRCAAQATCGDCAYMTLPDGSGRTCAWFDGGGVQRPWDGGGGGGGGGGGYCGPPGCDQTGCGDPDPANCPAEEAPCGSIGSCGACLAAPGCDAWSTGTCFESCMGAPMDAACYSQEYINGTPESICQQAADDGADDALCGAQSDCASCTATTLTGGDATCQWYADASYCAAGCGMEGCGSTTCDACALDGLCLDPSGACRGVGAEWFLDDGCTKCTCAGPPSGSFCVNGCLEELPPSESNPNLSVVKEGAGCDGTTVDVTCTLMGDDSTACHEYLPADSSECTVEVKYSYNARQVAPPTNVILASVLRERDDSYHGSPRAYVEGRWGQNLTPTSMASYEMNSWEGEYVNFCLRDIKPPTTLEFKTDVCTATATYELVQSADVVAQLPAAPVTVASAEPLVPTDGKTTDVLDEDGTSAAATNGASTVRFLTIFAVGAVLMVW